MKKMNVYRLYSAVEPPAIILLFFFFLNHFLSILIRIKNILRRLSCNSVEIVIFKKFLKNIRFYASVPHN